MAWPRLASVGFNYDRPENQFLNASPQSDPRKVSSFIESIRAGYAEIPILLRSCSATRTIPAFGLISFSRLAAQAENKCLQCGSFHLNELDEFII